MDAVYALLQQSSARKLTMEAVAREAGVGKPTLYNWWPSKSALIMDMFHERIASMPEPTQSPTAEEAIRVKVKRLIRLLNGLFGKVVSELIAEAQSDAAIMEDLHTRHMNVRWEAIRLDVERGKANGEFRADTDPDIVIQSIFGAMYYRLLLKFGPLTQTYGERLVDQVLTGIRPVTSTEPARRKAPTERS
jgi:AcrR family transcriptional regulator